MSVRERTFGPLASQPERSGFGQRPRAAWRWIGLTLLLGSVHPASAALRFIDQTADLGVTFVHHHFGQGEKFMIETMGSGVAVFDADGDGRLDLYFVQGAPLPGAAPDPSAVNRLYRQKPDGTFEDVTERSGAGDAGYGMGAAYGDIDDDGDLDLYVTNFGPNALYRNRGDGTFEDITSQSGTGSPLWSTSAGFFDADTDGDLDLYVVHYVDFRFDHHKWCGDPQKQIRAYCHPDVYEEEPDRLYLNDGTGRFTEAEPESAGLPRDGHGKGLGLSFADLDDDGRTDVYIANDSTMNHLLLGKGDGTFKESALLAGVGFNGAGAAEAGMGVEIGDVDQDGRQDIFLTHLDQETNTLYRSLGSGLFLDGTTASGLGPPSLPLVGFGTILFDADNDGDLDLFVTNGHIIDNIRLFQPERRYRQPSQLFENDGTGKFVENRAALNLPLDLVGRGAAAGDLDRDGDLDLVLTQNDGPAYVLINGTDRPQAALAVRLRGTKSNALGYGARVTLKTSSGVQIRDARSASSYLSQNAPELHFGLGADSTASELIVRWPSGQLDRHGPLSGGRLYTMTEGAATIEAQPFREPPPAQPH